MTPDDLAILTTDSALSPWARAAKNARALLRRHFPGVRFSVRSEAYSMGSSLYVSWLKTGNAPLQNEVEQWVLQFRTGDCNSIDDSYNYDNDPERRAFREAHGSVRYVFCSANTPSEEEQAQMGAKKLTAALPAAQADAVRRRRARL